MDKLYLTFFIFQLNAMADLGNIPGSTNILSSPNCAQCLPLDRMGQNTYKGFQGGLYRGNNEVPASHHQAGLNIAHNLKPLTSNGKIIVLGLGMSNANKEFCGGSRDNFNRCNQVSFLSQVRKEASSPENEINFEKIEIINGAIGGSTADTWQDPLSQKYSEVQQRIESLGYKENQIQVVWIKLAHGRPTHPLTQNLHPEEDAVKLKLVIGDVNRAVKKRYPNVKMLFISSRTYGGYAITDLNPEPFAYEGGFAVKWAIEDQISQMETGRIVSNIGNLDYREQAVWMAWGPYLWANADKIPNAHNVSYLKTDYSSYDFTHPSAGLIFKVGNQLLNFFRSSPYTSPWFLK